MAKTHNKLVRDLIPEIIQKSGNKAVIRTLNDQEYSEMLEKKLLEEANEYITDKTVEELADILEVVYALASLKGATKEEVEGLRIKKAEERGGFEKKIFLERVEEDE